ncbi:MAG TPA: hypothetical protein VMW62_05220 [Chloroflexota bacterium]|nr:hypothetical protein [Chloroflexota bacterium]
MLYPLAVAVVSAVFAAAVLRQYVHRRRPYQLVWMVALLMSALASAIYGLALPPTSSQVAFRAYYILGGLLMPAWLGLGSIYLVAPRRVADLSLAGLVNAGALGAGAVLSATIDPGALARLNGGPGTGVLEPGPWLPITILLNTCGVLAVVGVAIYSTIRLAQRRGSGRLVAANVLIAIGDLVVGVAGSMARTGRPELFWVTMLAGWVVIFVGFLLTQPAPARGSRLDSGPHSQSRLAAPAGRTPAA